MIEDEKYAKLKMTGTNWYKIAADAVEKVSK